MTMTTALELLPEEILEIIVTFLDFSSVCSLHAVSRSLADKTSRGVYKSHFYSEDIKPDARSVSITNRSVQTVPLAGLLRDLTVTFDHLDRSQQPIEVVELLNLISSLQSLMHLRSLRLNAARLNSCPPIGLELEERKWRSRFRTGACIAKAIVAGLTDSEELPIETLDLFSAIEGYSLPINFIQLSAKIECASLTNVRCLALSLSHSLRGEDQNQDASNSVAMSTRNLKTLSEFLKLMPRLEEIDLHWYCLYERDRTEGDKQDQRFFDYCHEYIPSMTLKSCVLRGLHMTQETLLSFLRQRSMQRLVLREIHLYEGTYTAILETLARPDSRLVYLHLDDLFEHFGRPPLIYFNVPGKPKFWPCSGSYGPSEIIREGESIKQKLSYSYSPITPLGSELNNQWRRQRRILYGHRSHTDSRAWY